MDWQFMNQFYSKMYEEPEKEAVNKNEEYAAARYRREQAEEKLLKLMEKESRELQNGFADLMLAMNEQQRILEKAMYMMGAKDRERMLR